MKVYYIGHSGFLVETDKSYYAFDYYQGDLPKLCAEKPIAAFSSHSHRDHYNREIFEMLKNAGMQSVLAVLSSDIKKRIYPEGISVMQVRAGETYTLPNGECLETLRSTDRGVAVLLDTGCGVIFHAGDLNDWTWEGESDGENRAMRTAYRREIDNLCGRRIDAAFLPLDPRQEQHYADGMLYFLEQNEAKNVFPMHYWNEPDVIRRFLEEYPQYTGRIRFSEDAKGETIL